MRDPVTTMSGSAAGDSSRAAVTGSVAPLSGTGGASCACAAKDIVMTAVVDRRNLQNDRTMTIPFSVLPGGQSLRTGLRRDIFPVSTPLSRRLLIRCYRTN